MWTIEFDARHCATIAQAHMVPHDIAKDDRAFDRAAHAIGPGRQSTLPDGNILRPDHHFDALPDGSTAARFGAHSFAAIQPNTVQRTCA